MDLFVNSGILEVTFLPVSSWLTLQSLERLNAFIPQLLNSAKLKASNILIFSNIYTIHKSELTS